MGPIVSTWEKMISHTHTHSCSEHMLFSSPGSGLLFTYQYFKVLVGTVQLTAVAYAAVGKGEEAMLESPECSPTPLLCGNRTPKQQSDTGLFRESLHVPTSLAVSCAMWLDSVQRDVRKGMGCAIAVSCLLPSTSSFSSPMGNTVYTMVVSLFYPIDEGNASGERRTSK